MEHLRTGLFAATTLLAISLATNPAFAATYYASPSGSGNGTSESTPASVSSAVNSAQPGDTVYFRGGIYSGWSGTIHPVRSGTASAWITFEAYPGELPIFDTGGIGSGTYEYIRYVGLVSRNGSSGGFGNGWTNGDCNPMSNGNLQYINCIADNNGINGIAHYCASGLLIKQSIVAHNGNLDPSWSSGVNLFGAQGSSDSNVVEQTISFENIDISSHHSDGSGFILDQNSTGATFINNIGFRNGGSCIRLTNSSNAQLINNTCVNDGLDPAALYHDEIFFSDSKSRTGALLRNNLCIPTSGQRGLAMGDGVPAENNEFEGTGDMIVSATGDLDFHLVSGASPIDAAASGTPTPGDDIGFDWRCIKQQSGQAVSWWNYAIDYDYIESIGGVAACFQPGARSGAPDIGAYEFGASTSTGGAGGTGGTEPGGAETGGAVTGGAPETGGAGDTGGVAVTGGGPVTGGAPTTGGATVTGGVGAGGATVTGGATATGGATVTGGVPATGGVAPMGGAPTTGGASMSGGASVTGGASAAGPCQSPLVPCGTACVNLASDPLNCGACSNVCGANMVCSNSACESTCGAGLTACMQTCANTMTDILNCGACGFVCGGGQTCVQGQCTGQSDGTDPTVPDVPAAETGSDQESGCACATAGGEKSQGTWLALGLALALARRRRRRH